MRVRNGYWLVGRAGRWSGGLKAVRAGARRGEAAPVVCGGSPLCQHNVRHLSLLI